MVIPPPDRARRSARALVRLLAVVALSASGPLAAAADAGAASHRPGRLVVKYRGLDACVSCALDRRQPLADAAGAPNLDELHRRLDVRRARPLFARALPTRGRSAAFADRLARVRARFPERAARAPRDATAPDLGQVYVLELPAGADVAAAAAAYAADPHVAYAHPDVEVRAGLVPNDTYFASLYGMQITAAPSAWDVGNGAGTVVAVIDTGIDHAHPDLAANVWTNAGEVAGNGLDDDGNGFVDDVRGWDFVDDDGQPFDDNGHGTHVAGIAAAVGDNALGVVGMAYGARVMGVKGLDASGSGWVSDLAAGIVYAAENGADVLNNSWSGFGISGVLVDAVDTARALGAVVVAAAGNGSTFADRRQPAGIPGVIAVGASDASDAIASFSNHGESLSVAAPGVSVLSLRGSRAGGLGNAGIVGAQYQSLSGTSMATPHVAGLAALLLSVMPGLTPDEVRWHLELNAHQPGVPGWVGEPWNPYFGWGRIDASRIFDPPPATTRLTRTPRTLHAITETLLPDASFVDLAFTTADPVAWTLAAPSWLAATPSAGSEGARVMLDLDVRGEPVGTLAAPLVVSAPGTIDGGASLDFTVHVHRDERVGAAVLLDQPTPDQNVEDGPAVASDGVGTFVVRSYYGLHGAHYERRVRATRFDGAGNEVATTEVPGDYEVKSSVAVAFDGRHYLVVWAENADRSAAVKGLRFAADGTPIDAHAFVIESRSATDSQGIGFVDVGFDGTGYTVLWEFLSSKTDVGKVYVRRVGVDGNLRGRKHVQIYPDRSGRLPQFVFPSLGCAAGRCLAAWAEADGETDATGRYVRKVYGTMLHGDRPASLVAQRLLADGHHVYDVASDGGGFAVLVARTVRCPESIDDVVVLARVAADGTPLDPDGIRVDRQAPGSCAAEATPLGLAFDGSRYLAAFRVQGPTGADGVAGHYLFGVGVAPDGTVLDDEYLGVLLHERPVPLLSNDGFHLAASRLSTSIGWIEQRIVGTSGIFLVAERETRMQRVFPTGADPGHPEATIGAIGPRSVAERADLLLTVRAPAGFAPESTTLTATGLPPGAVFDPPTGVFRWRPSGLDAGLVAAVTFEAADGVETAAETVAITVGESVLTLGGRVRLADGTPVTDVGVRLAGVPREKRVAFTDAAGRWTAEGLAPRSYRAKLDPASSKRYRVVSSPPKAALAADTVLPDLVIEPK